MSGLCNPHLEELRRRIQVERLRRADVGYVDAHVRQIAIALVVCEIDKPEELTMDQSLGIFAGTTMTMSEYIVAMSFISPDHAERLRNADHAGH